jgi:peptide/nickel transport system permease protein
MWYELKLRWRTLTRSYATRLGILLVVLVFLTALLANQLAPYAYDDMAILDKLKPPSREHLLGTDQFGRDVLSRIIYGARVSLLVGVGGTLVAMVAGVLLGASAAYLGGWWDEVLMRVLDIWMAFPYIVLAIVLAWIIGPGLINLILVIGIIRSPHFTRITRGSVLAQKELEFVDAARAIGQNGPMILLRHILPNCISPIIVYATLCVATAISAEAALSFLGLGIQPPTPSWGMMLAEGRRFMRDAFWMPTFPGIAISLTILGYNILGDGLRDALDPRMRR